MKASLVVGVALVAWSAVAQALSPYVDAGRASGGTLDAAVADVEGKLVGAGFRVLGRYTPRGLPQHAIVVASDEGLQGAALAIGGSAIVAVPLRVDVRADGSVRYANPEYWARAYLRGDYARAEAAVRAASDRLAGALGGGRPAGGDVKADDLPGYRYMLGMERFGDRSELAEHASFDEAVQAVRANLASGVGGTARVYEVVVPERKLAVFGVALNDAEHGEGWWVGRIGADNAAALPWEIWIADRKVHALYGRYRTALGWPELGMGQFMTIMRHPDTTMQALEGVARKP
ncbi:hypothetical protein BURK1_03770 [Burkholderiales bacterium]|nr:hypothetical protein BURK1_03770 [Burkholderiales bacterium]